MSLLFLQHMNEPFVHRVGKSPLVRARTNQLASSARSSAGWLSFSHITSREIVRKFYDEKRALYFCLRDHTGCVSLFSLSISYTKQVISAVPLLSSFPLGLCTTASAALLQHQSHCSAQEIYNFTFHCEHNDDRPVTAGKVTIWLGKSTLTQRGSCSLTIKQNRVCSKPKTMSHDAIFSSHLRCE